ncbi:MAG TPA: tRNA (adenosine(37)-N6)-threonylcarbamoyltransferase complex dimerization subunit type 1 TsaB [Vicinamibacterales bacterium]|jgi:tRNA threonylcarbamoyladenosine biosynthesis protein TsaB|nr:tRNA (adenosine(37)-N6)-threonylcarbamoyltransferase complex dimerization subunit type 1 TsaB [Vicinamibacterales bacterium]
MKVLALDTTTRAGSVAIVDGDHVIDERGGDEARGHAERLPGEILAIAAANQTPLDSVDLFAVASGPGSFTGLRIGIATVQGFAFVQGRGMVGVSALEALAHCASVGLSPGAQVAAWMDAYRRDVFAALYRVTEAPAFDPDRLVELDPPSVNSPSVTWARWSNEFDVPSVIIGDGAVLYEALVRPSRVMRPPLIAGAIGRLAVSYMRRGGAVHPSAVHPLYVRRPDAEITREKGSSG